MISRRLPLSAFIVIVFVLSGCASHSASNIGSRTVSSEEVHQAVHLNQDRILSLQGDGKLTVETPNFAQSGSFTLTLRKPDSLLLKIEGPFGIAVGAALVTRGEFLFYNSLRNQLISGATNSANLGKVLRVEITFDDVMNLFAGGAFFKEDELPADEVSVDDEQFLLTYRPSEPGGSVRKYWIDPVSLLITRIHHLDADGKVLFEQRFSNYKTIDGVTVPMFVQITQPKDRRRISISYSELSPNVNPVQFTFNIPGNAERIEIR